MKRLKKHWNNRFHNARALSCFGVTVETMKEADQ